MRQWEQCPEHSMGNNKFRDNSSEIQRKATRQQKLRRKTTVRLYTSSVRELILSQLFCSCERRWSTSCSFCVAACVAACSRFRLLLRVHSTVLKAWSFSYTYNMYTSPVHLLSTHHPPTHPHTHTPTHTHPHPHPHPHTHTQSCRHFMYAYILTHAPAMHTCTWQYTPVVYTCHVHMATHTPNMCTCKHKHVTYTSQYLSTYAPVVYIFQLMLHTSVNTYTCHVYLSTHTLLKIHFSNIHLSAFTPGCRANTYTCQNVHLSKHTPVNIYIYQHIHQLTYSVHTSSEHVHLWRIYMSRFNLK